MCSDGFVTLPSLQKLMGLINSVRQTAEALLLGRNLAKMLSDFKVSKKKKPVVPDFVVELFSNVYTKIQTTKNA